MPNQYQVLNPWVPLEPHNQEAMRQFLVDYQLIQADTKTNSPRFMSKKEKIIEYEKDDEEFI